MFNSIIEETNVDISSLSVYKPGIGKLNIQKSQRPG